MPRHCRPRHSATIVMAGRIQAPAPAIVARLFRPVVASPHRSIPGYPYVLATLAVARGSV